MQQDLPSFDQPPETETPAPVQKKKATAPVEEAGEPQAGVERSTEAEVEDIFGPAPAKASAA